MEPITPTYFGIMLTIGLAVVAVFQLGVTRWADSRKEKRDAERAIAAAKATAELKAEEKRLDWARQDEVAARVEGAAKQAASAAELLVQAQEDTIKRTDEVARTATARQEEIANRVAEAAKQAADAAALLLSAQADTIKRTDEVAKMAAEADARVGEQLKKIHILVNSDMTAARTAERKALQRLLLELKKHILDPASPEQDELVRVEKRITELDEILADRLAAQHRVDAATKPDIVTTIMESQEKLVEKIEVNTADTARSTAQLVKDLKKPEPPNGTP